MSSRILPTIVRNTFWLTLGLLVSRLLTLVAIRKMTPALGPNGLGVWAWAADVTAIALVVMNYGLDQLITREALRNPPATRRILWAALRVRWAMALVCFFILAAYVTGTDKESLARAAMLITAVAVLFESSAQACDAVLQARVRFGVQSLSQLISAVFFVTAVFWSLEAGHGLMGVVWSNLLSRALRLLVVGWWLAATVGPTPGKADPGAPGHDVSWALRTGWPVFLSTTLGMVFFKIDIVMLTEMVGQAATGIYFLGHRALDYLYLVPHLLATSMYPALTQRAAAGRAQLTLLSEKALRYTMLITVTVTLLTMLAAAPLIAWFDPAGAFRPSVDVLRLVIWGMPFMTMHIVLSRVLLAAERERDFIPIALVTMVIGIGANLLLIPRYSYMGAATASVISLGVSAALHVFYCRRAALAIPLLRSVVGSTAGVLAAWAATVLIVRLVVPGWAPGWTSLPDVPGWGPALAVVGLWLVLIPPMVLAFRVATAEDVRQLADLLHRGGESA